MPLHSGPWARCSSSAALMSWLLLNPDSAGRYLSVGNFMLRCASVRCCNMKRAMTLLGQWIHPKGKRWYALCMDRVSVRQQQRSGLGIEAQRAAVQRFAEAEAIGDHSRVRR